MLVHGGLSAPKAQAETYIAGDSIGVGVGMVAQYPSVAAISISIRGSKIIDQLRAIPDGSTVFLSLGTNDAVSNLVKGGGDLDRLVEFMNGKRFKVFWIGPPCVLKPWDDSAKKLDESLHSELAKSRVTYISMREPTLCDPASRAKDGVHFTMAGYRIIWQRAAEAANIKPATQIAPVRKEPTQTVAAKKKRKRTVKKTTNPVKGNGPPK